jgi:hypothetical protein
LSIGRSLVAPADGVEHPGHVRGGWGRICHLGLRNSAAGPVLQNMIVHRLTPSSRLADRYSHPKARSTPGHV